MKKAFVFPEPSAPAAGIVTERPSVKPNRNVAALYHGGSLPQDEDGNIQLGADRSEYEKWVRESSRAVGIHMDPRAIERESEYIFASRPPEWIFDLRPMDEVKAAFNNLTQHDNVDALKNKIARGIAILTAEARKKYPNALQQHDYVSMVSSKTMEVLDEAVESIAAKIKAEMFTEWTDFETKILQDLKLPANVPSVTLAAIIESIEVKAVPARPAPNELAAVTYTGSAGKAPSKPKRKTSRKTSRKTKQ